MFKEIILLDEELELILFKKTAANEEREGYVPAFYYTMRNKYTLEIMGRINLRIGNNENLEHYAGHLGYEVNKKFRGNKYAERSCRLLLSVAKKEGLEYIIITCNPQNIASRKTAENLGARLIGVIDLPKDNDQYRIDDIKRCKYRIEL